MSCLPPFPTLSLNLSLQELLHTAAILRSEEPSLLSKGWWSVKKDDQSAPLPVDFKYVVECKTKFSHLCTEF